MILLGFLKNQTINNVIRKRIKAGHLQPTARLIEVNMIPAAINGRPSFATRKSLPVNNGDI